MQRAIKPVSTPGAGQGESPPIRFIRLPEVRKITGLSRSQLYRLEADDESQFPKRVKLGAGPASATAWVEAEIMHWCASRVAASRRSAA